MEKFTAKKFYSFGSCTTCSSSNFLSQFYSFFRHKKTFCTRHLLLLSGRKPYSCSKPGPHSEHAFQHCRRISDRPVHRGRARDRDLNVEACREVLVLRQDVLNQTLPRSRTSSRICRRLRTAFHLHFHASRLRRPQSRGRLNRKPWGPIIVKLFCQN